MTAVRILKRRALVARLLTCAVPFAIALTGTASAYAKPVAPFLVTTNPPSSEEATAASTSPAILGEAEPEDGIILKRTPFSTGALVGPVTHTVEKPTAHPNYEIKIFQSAECLGSVVASGTASTLEEAGITVSALADAATTFSALQVDPEHTSEPSLCSNPLTYWEGNAPTKPVEGGGGAGGGTGTGESGNSGGTAPGGATSTGTSTGKSSNSGVGGANPAGGKPHAPSLHMIPGERANDTTPSVAGSAPGANTVTIFAGANCSGTPVAKGTPGQLGAGFEVSVTENASTTFSAVSIGAQRSACSDPVTYTEDSLAPRTRITMAVFRFTDITEDPAGTTFKCKVDKAKWKPCASPFRIKHLKLGRHALKIRATDTAGNVERMPVKRGFIVVSPLG
jgi:hypothetical protein